MSTGVSTSGAVVPDSPIRLGQSFATSAVDAARELHDAIAQPGAEAMAFFCSSRYDLDVLAAEIARLFAGMTVIGCTAAGEIGPEAYSHDGITGVSFASSDFAIVAARLEGLDGFERQDGRAFVRALVEQLAQRVGDDAQPRVTGAVMLIDGLSVREEQVVSALQAGLGGIPLLGGSAGDDEEFRATYVYHEGEFHQDAAVVALVSTELPVRPVLSQHFVASGQRVVVTSSEPRTRTVHELDGLPAATVYARMVGAEPQDLTSAHFALAPLVIVIAGTTYVRSIQRANPDGSLTFYCAIEEGLVLRLGEPQDLLHQLSDSFDLIREELGTPLLVLGCDCILRRLEINHTGITDDVHALMRANNTIAFNSYGEQFRGVHVNQTFTGLAIGARGGALR